MVKPYLMFTVWLQRTETHNLLMPISTELLIVLLYTCVYIYVEIDRLIDRYIYICMYVHNCTYDIHYQSYIFLVNAWNADKPAMDTS